jgi:DNA-binding PadR family transcriptional regulator
MTTTDHRAERYLPLTETTFCILAALGEPRHGYAVMQRVDDASRGRIRLGPGTLYGALTKLLQQGLIARTGETEIAGERRKLYVLTELGRVVVAAEHRRLVDLINLSRELLGTHERELGGAGVPPATGRSR